MTNERQRELAPLLFAEARNVEARLLVNAGVPQKGKSTRGAR
jgi:hypothetical protein